METKGLSTQVLSPDESEKVHICYYKNQDVLLWNSRPHDALEDHEWQVHNQIVVPRAFRQTVIGLPHDTPMLGQLGIKKLTVGFLFTFWA